MKPIDKLIQSDLYRYTGDISSNQFYNELLFNTGFRYLFVVRKRAFFQQGIPFYENYLIIFIIFSGVTIPLSIRFIFARKRISVMAVILDMVRILPLRKVQKLEIMKIYIMALQLAQLTGAK